MRSMTGFGQAADSNEQYQVTVTIRTVNHRHLDLNVRLDDSYQRAETPLRELIGSELLRGRVDVTIDVRALQPATPRVRLNRSLLAALQGELRQLQSDDLVRGELQAGDALQLPEVLEVQVQAAAWTEGDQELLLGAAATALAQVVETRQREGSALRDLLEARQQGLLDVHARLVELRPQAVEEIHRNLLRRLQDMLDGPGSERRALDEQRLAQEVALLADRSDVAEELDRLSSHLGHLQEMLESEGSIGKRLDFLAQEIFRELNTVGSKCRHKDMTRTMLDGKVLCEQLREQIQNVE